MAQEESVDCNVVNLNKISISEFIQKHKKELSNNIKFSLLSTQMLDLPETCYHCLLPYHDKYECIYRNDDENFYKWKNELLTILKFGYKDIVRDLLKLSV